MLGDGKLIRFWKDKWLGREALEVKYFRLFSISNDKVANLSQVSSWNNNQWFWKLEWRRSLFEWEEREANQLVNFLNEKSLAKDIGDHWVWKTNENLGYTVNSTYKCLITEVEGDFRSIYKFFWSLKALPSFMTTVGRVLADRLPTRVNLEKIGIVLDNILCVMCGEEEETGSHVFFLMQSSLKVWCFCCKWLGEKTVFYCNAKTHLL